MAAQTFTADRAATTLPVFKNLGAGNVSVAYGSYTLAEVPEVGDIWQLCRIPSGAVVLGGYFAASDIDSGVETLDIDLGWAANGGEAADPDGFANMGVISGDTVVDVANGVVANMRHLAFTTPPTFTKETTVQAQCVAVANAGGTGTISCAIYYVNP
jgi:hypothetical protein